MTAALKFWLAKELVGLAIVALFVIGVALWFGYIVISDKISTWMKK